MSNPILVEVYRGEVLESFHRGVICIVNDDKQVIYEAGNIHQLCYPRSALKFFQQIPLLMYEADKSFGFTDEEIAVCCGSHNGEDIHVNAVDSILAKIGLGREALKCGPQYPTHRKIANHLIANNKKPEAIHNNCSGKHAGFLALCVFLGLNTEDYLSAVHRIQKEIKTLVSEFHDYPENLLHLALDGCSAPIYSIPVYNQAIGYMKLAKISKEDSKLGIACKRLLNAVSAHPLMIAGNGRYCSDLLAESAYKIIGKTGAEGIFSLAFTDYIYGACIKIDDGKMLPQYNIAQKLVRQSGLLGKESLERLAKYEEAKLSNFNKLETGRIKVADAILPNKWC